ncbi:MAG TPA: histidine kinase dimerization/phospho-acceptor domain-containing protein, partial [Amycolatopsis sp.]|nr:histidine kinase dimerization/phospho-acceptor domain-containing protein [Amycolatopsis sp.]
MSSSPRAEPPPTEGKPRGRRPWSLRRRLIVQLAALLALVCLVVGGITQFALRGFLIDQLDQRLAAASDRGFRGSRPPVNPTDTPRPLVLLVRGQAPGTLALEVRDGVVLSGVMSPGSPPPSSGGRPLRASDPFNNITSAQETQLLGLVPDGHRHTIDLGGSLGEYRVIASHGPGGVFTVIGLPMEEVTATLWQLALIFGGVALGGIVVAGAVGAATIRRTMQPLDRLAATATRVSELKLDSGEVALSERVPESDTDPNTEVGKVGAALNRMLGHISNALAARHASESRVRQFVADASHELRTPLAAIRGYAELTRRSSEEVPPDVAFAMNRVESESRRMTALVEDLLLLARLDSGRPVVHEWVDVCRLVADAVADASVAGRDHKWLLDAPGEPVGVLGDAGQLHQIVINLLANARTHTPAGTTVTSSVSTKDGIVRVRVVDDGPGIPREVLPEVFERFARGDNSRSRAA